MNQLTFQGDAPVSEPHNLRKRELACMRLAADCMQLVGDVHSPDLQRHFLRMAKSWTAQAEWGPDADSRIKIN